ncbi:hypothetical protein [uncultured Neglectibacter sp.]|uniref:hypothetical protein n=1 Tax=uncultured Neglectibacter sp. TaxID=1924108 RepID=UPI0034DF7374
MKKRVFALLLAVVMLLGFTACGNNGTSSAGGQTSSKGGGSQPVSSQVGSGEDEPYSGPMTLEEVPSPTKDPFGKYDPPITVTTIHTANDGAFWFAEGENLEDNVYTRRYAEQLGINYEFKWTCPGSQAAEKMNTMLTSGDLPDFLSVDRTTFEKMYAADLLEDITVPLIEYASEYTRKYLTGDYSYLLDTVTKDGRYYGITNGFSYQDGGDMLWIRKDWLDKLNLKTPETMEDLEAVMEAFKTQDPDGNGVDDTYAVAMSASSQNAWQWTLGNAFFNMFNAYPNVWYENSKGEIESGLFGEESRERTRAALEKAAEYYQKGYFPQDFATMDADMQNEDIFNGKCGIFVGDVWGAYWPLILHLDHDPEADWIAVPVVSGPYGEGKIARDAAQTQNILVATKGCEHPEALVKMTNLYHDLNNNPETMEFGTFNTNPEDNNQPFLMYPLNIYNPSFNYEGHIAIKEAEKTGNTDGLCEAYKQFYDQAQAYENEGDKAGFPAYRSYLTEGSSFEVIETYLDNKRIVFNEYTAEETPFMIENGPTVKKMYDEMAIQVITGKADITAFDSFMQSYDEIYGTKATEEVNQWFQDKGGVSVQSQMK